MGLEWNQNIRDAKNESIERDEEIRLAQGARASEIFRGEVMVEPVKKIFGESAQMFSALIKERLGTEGGRYVLADFGSHEGELLENICKSLSEFDFHTIGIDLENNLKENKAAQEKVSADLGNIPMKDKSVDVGFARYVLHWNDIKKQENILKEIARIVKDFAIIQHVGADCKNSSDWRSRVDDLLDGQEIPKLERHGHFFSSSQEIEKMLTKNNIPFERVSEIRVNDLSETLSQRFSLDKAEKQLAKEMLKGKDYIMQTTWIIKSKNKE
jgi:ubiquinone/menaquinone biosynthesis C-methylase UbiE